MKLALHIRSLEVSQVTEGVAGTRAENGAFTRHQGKLLLMDVFGDTRVVDSGRDWYVPYPIKSHDEVPVGIPLHVASKAMALVTSILSMRFDKNPQPHSVVEFDWWYLSLLARAQGKDIKPTGESIPALFEKFSDDDIAFLVKAMERGLACVDELIGKVLKDATETPDNIWGRLAANRSPFLW